MKKVFFILVIAVLYTVNTFAQESSFTYEIYKDGKWLTLEADPANIEAKIVLTSSTYMWRDLSIHVSFPQAGYNSVDLRLESISYAPKTLNANSSDDSEIAGFCLNSSGRFKTFMTKTGSIKVTEFNESERLISGEFEAESSLGEKIKGEFKNIIIPE